jgi:YD repeat-containing protein
VGTATPVATAIPALATTTGINSYWSYEEEKVPGIGRAMVNVGTGNFLLQADDVDIPERGIDLAFRRTYNSQSGHDASNADGSVVGLYGNRWTATFDAHMAYNATTNVLSIVDIDGARYDYSSSGNGTWNPPPGQHAKLTSDGGYGYYWSKKNGTVYYFHGVNEPAGYGGYTGRLYQILARNENSVLTFTYSWANGDSSTIANLTGISVSHNDGDSLTLTFALFGSNLELSSITRPDGSVISYSYDSTGNLLEVERPGNNFASSLPESYGYSGELLTAIGSPRATLSAGAHSGNPVDGATFSIAYDASSRVTTEQQRGVMNFTPSDGTSVALQSGVATGFALWWQKTFSGYGSGTTSMTDSDGHATNYAADGSARVTQTSEWNGSLYLVTTEKWDANDNLMATTDARGNETDYGYDTNGNTTVVAKPQVVTSAGTLRPTQTYSYDSFNNVVAYCAEDYVGNWPGNIAVPSDSYCPSGSRATNVTFTYPSYEPVGEIASITTPLGYTRSFAYSTSAQGGADYGLPTSVTGTAISQMDGSTRTPLQSFTYDAHGNVICYSSGSGTWLSQYDSLNRATAHADPDDGSISGCGKPASSSSTASYIAYYPNGQISQTQTPSQHANGIGTTFTYDADGDELTETHHHGCTPSSCTAGVTTKTYDGADRLVEVAMPHDPTDFYPFPYLTRYLYDLTGDGVVSVGPVGSGGTAFSPHGNLYKTQEWLPTGGVVSSASPPAASSAAWTDVRGNAFDPLDRPVSKFTLRPRGTWGTQTSSYDGTQTLDLLASTTDEVGDQTTYTYDALGREAGISFSGDGGVTPARQYTYDPRGLVTQTTSSVFGTLSKSYDYDGNVQQVVEPTGGGVTSPATITYGYYGDNKRSSLSVSSSGLTQSNLFTYSYRADGLSQNETVNHGSSSYPFSWAYSSAGRVQTAGDYTSASARTYSYDSFGRLAGTVMPTGPYSSFAYDEEDQPISYTIPPVDPSNTSNHIGYTNQYNVRGELIATTTSVGPPTVACGPSYGAPLTAVYSDFAATSANGYMVSRSSGCATDSFTFTFDPVNDVQLDHATQTADLHGYIYDISTAYDAAGRQTTSSSTYTGTTSCVGNTEGSPVNKSSGTSTRSYDAENHLVGQVSANYLFSPSAGCSYPGQVGTINLGYQWGPNGHPILFGSSNYQGNFSVDGTVAATNTPTALVNRTLHWDGDTLLFTSAASGTVDAIYVSTLAVLSPATASTSVRMEVADRDFSGQAVSEHPSVVAGQSPIWSGQEGLYGTVAPLGPPGYFRTDGITDSYNTFQGVRSMDPATGSWTAPDAYAGDVHDPLTQKPYIWNNNNPILYSDPSGYRSVSFWEWAGAAIKDIGRTLICPISCSKSEPLEMNKLIAQERPKGVPENWRETNSDTPGGQKWVDPNDTGNTVRTSPGNPNSEFPNSRTPYVRQTVNGRYVDKDGKFVARKAEEGHIPLQDFRFRTPDEIRNINRGNNSP